MFASDDDLERDDRQNGPDRVDEDPLRLQNRRNSRLQPHATDERCDDRRPGDREESPAQDRQRQAPAEDQPGRGSRKNRGDQDPERRELLDAPRLAAKALELQIHRPFEENH